MSNSTVFLVCYFIMMAFILLIFYVEFKDQKKFSKGKNNRIFSESGMYATFVYRIPHSKEKVIEILSHKNAQDRLAYEFDKQSMVIGFKNPDSEFYHRSGIEARYKMRFEDKGDSCLLYLEQMNLFSSEKYVPMRMNAFWAIKVDAAPYEI